MQIFSQSLLKGKSDLHMINGIAHKSCTAHLLVHESHVSDLHFIAEEMEIDLRVVGDSGSERIVRVKGRTVDVQEFMDLYFDEYLV